MFKIRNRLDQPLLVHRGQASPLHLLAWEAAVVSAEELATPHLQALIAAGALESKALAGAKKSSSKKAGG